MYAFGNACVSVLVCVYEVQGPVASTNAHDLYTYTYIYIEVCVCQRDIVFDWCLKPNGRQHLQVRARSIYACIYSCVGVLVCVCVSSSRAEHLRMRQSIHVFIYVCVCVRVSADVLKVQGPIKSAYSHDLYLYTYICVTERERVCVSICEYTVQGPLASAYAHDLYIYIYIHARLCMFISVCM